MKTLGCGEALARPGICLAAQVEGFRASSWPPLGAKIPSSAELFSRCLSAVTASAGPWRGLDSQTALWAAQEAGDREP